MQWFKKKEYPDFWKAYLLKQQHKETNVNTMRFVVFDTETTGLSLKEDRILSIGTVAIENLTIKVHDSLECYVNQHIFKNESVKIHGILKKGRSEKINEDEAIKLFLNHVGNAVLIAHHAAFDVAMINASLKRMGLGTLKNRVLDLGYIYKKAQIKRSSKAHVSLDELANQFNIPKHDRHTAAGDAFITALLFLKILAKFQSKQDIRLHDLESPVSKISFF